MPRQSVLVVDESPALRETVSVLLAGEYAVAALDPADLATCGSRPDLVIAPPQLRARLPAVLRDVPFLALSDAPAAAGAAALTRRFTPHQLRRQVAGALRRPAPPLVAAAASWRLSTPFLPAAAAATIADALAAPLPLPLHLSGEAGTGKRIIARAVHASAGGGNLVSLDGADPTAHHLDLGHGQTGTLLVTAVDRLTARAQHDLLDALDCGAAAHPNGLRVITTAALDLAELVERERFAHELFYRLSALVAQLPPLRERAADIPAIARLVADDIARRHRLGAVSFAPRALERLSHYLWPGNATELEAVLTRTLLRGGGAAIDADDILFEGTSPRPPRRAPAAGAAAPAAHLAAAQRNGKADLARNLDLIIHELAHDFRNPLVTIKTFAEHCRRALQEGADERRFAELTGEAVDQIDQALENLLHFTRLGPPAARPVALDALLAPLVAAHTAALAARQQGLAYAPPPGLAVHTDPEQATYALDNLLRALTRGLAPGESLSLQYCAPDALLFQLSAGARHVGDQLAGLLDESSSSPVLPLGIAIANAVLERNGAQVEVSDRGEPTTVMIRFPLVENAEVGVERNGTSSRAHR